ncbi:hypothetical protein HI914_03199 [Erysiphe necator]|uniref:Uncharacterized protein n=1 Tax=Uncinula necator TaxID=52586 RepID=A0A0B1P286_UNCNE|nr:hypothetical protein HI914_03199 [Erysiphe necator]KHJ31445.1 hypothetical protein EV44_g6316 [Erysiphe necator]
MEEKSIRITVTEASSINEKSESPEQEVSQMSEIKSLSTLSATPSSNNKGLTYPPPLDLSAQQNTLADNLKSLSPTDLKSLTIVSHRSFDGDLESQNFDTNQTQSSVSNTGLLHKSSYDPMWPNRHELKLKRKAMKRERAFCSWWADLSRKQRGIISTIVILAILGAGLSVGFGISKCVGGGVVNSKGPNAPVLFR